MEAPPPNFRIVGPEIHKFELGMCVTFSAGPPRWWVRLWRWIRRGFRKPPPPAVLTVVSIDHEAGAITYSAGTVTPKGTP
jgi:hypothetical protein